MRKIINTMLVLVLLAFVMEGCKKSFLTEEPRTVTIDDLNANPTEGAKRLVAAIYAKLYDWNVHSFSWNGISSMTSDDAEKGSDPGDAGTDKTLLDDWTFDATSLSFDEVWIGNYEGIGRANYALKYLPAMNIPAADKDRYIGEAKMLRAYYYWNLVRSFGGVLKIDRVLESQEEILAATTRATAQEIYDFIELDLSDAIMKLPPTIPASDNGRVTKYAAQALLSKVHLYQREWGPAMSMADAVINSTQYDLLDDYAMIWREAGEFSIESIWEVNAIGTSPNRGIEGYFVTQAPRGAGGLGWGFNTPTQDLYNAYEQGDERRDATIMRRGQTLWDGYQVSASAPNAFYNYKSYVSKTQETFNGEDWQTNKNLRILRYGEILLIKAEAANELLDTVAAKIALNELRDRAGVPRVNAISFDSMRNTIYKERRLEMAFEHDRTFDLRRTGRAEAVLRAHGKPYISPKHDLFPIPQNQINKSDNRISQNFGY